MPITQADRKALAADDLFEDEAEAVERAERSGLDAEYPKPDVMDILELKETLEAEWHEWRFGTVRTTHEDGTAVETYDQEGVPGLARVRAMRYHRDRMPEKWRKRLNTPYRYRTNFTANEITRTVALATRNVPRVAIPPSGDEPDDQDRADKERMFAQALLPALERQASRPLLRIAADALFEGGLAAFELFLTGSYDDIDLESGEEEEDDAYLSRTDKEMLDATKRRGMPIGVRVPDPMCLLYDEDDLGPCSVMIVERKQYRQVFRSLRHRVGDERLDELRLPKPGKGSALPDGTLNTGSGVEVECIRYYDRRWYAYVVAGAIVDIKEHGWFPYLPVLFGWGDTTSSARRAEQLQGVAWGMVEQEQALNDYITTRLDIHQTFGRPKPVIERDAQAPGTEDGPSLVDLSQDGAVRLRRGESIKDAYERFADRMGDGLLNTMIGIRNVSGINPVSAGDSPGSDPSGFAINSLQAASQMRYEILLDNYGRLIGQLIDLIRWGIQHGPIPGRMFVPVETGKGARDYIGLGDDDITDMPCEVTIDPMNDVNRLAIRQSLTEAWGRRLLPKRIVQQQGFGADNPEAWENEIGEEIAEEQFRALALEQAKMEIGIGAPAGPGGGSGLVGPDGVTPLSSGGGSAPSAEDGSVAAPPRGSSVGREVAARARGGQQPAGQGVPAGTPAGAR